MNDTLDEIFDDSDDEEESHDIVSQVLDEIGIEISGKVRAEILYGHQSNHVEALDSINCLITVLLYCVMLCISVEIHLCPLGLHNILDLKIFFNDYSYMCYMQQPSSNDAIVMQRI